MGKLSHLANGLSRAENLLRQCSQLAHEFCWYYYLNTFCGLDLVDLIEELITISANAQRQHLIHTSRLLTLEYESRTNVSALKYHLNMDAL